MPIVILAAGSPRDADVVERARTALAAGQLILYPTDTLYAVGGRALDPSVARAVRAAKGRADRKPLPVVAADVAQIRDLTTMLPRAFAALSERHWPGPLTLVLPAASHVPEEIVAGTGTIAVRIPDSALVRELCASVGPLIATSANRSGEPPAASCADAMRALGEHCALALDGGQASVTVVSTIVAFDEGRPRLVRAGAVPWEAVLATLDASVPR